jgi:nicotinamidase-related amidase
LALTTLDPKTALVVIDLQKGLMGIATAHPLADVVSQAARLATAFRGHRLPVVLVNATGRAPGRTEAGSNRRVGGGAAADWADIVDELGAQPPDLRVSKTRWGAFHGTDLDAQLRDLGVTQVVFAGVATSAGVESTARAAHEHGYHVVLAIDAMTDTSADAHRNSVGLIFPKIGETATTSDIVAMLEETR